MVSRSQLGLCTLVTCGGIVAFLLLHLKTRVQPTDLVEPVPAHPTVDGSEHAKLSEVEQVPIHSTKTGIVGTEQSKVQPHVPSSTTTAFWEMRLKTLQKALADFQSEQEHQPNGAYETMLLNVSIAAILESRGTYRDLTDSSQLMGGIEKQSDHRFMLDTRMYWFDKGYFSEYDAFSTFSKSMIEYNDRLEHSLPPGEKPTFDPAYYDLYLERAMEAISIAEAHVR